METRHTSSPSISRGNGTQFSQTLDVKYLLLRRGENSLDGSSRRRNVLERGSSGLGRVEGSGELGYQGVRAESVEQVDVPGRSREYWGTKQARVRCISHSMSKLYGSPEKGKVPSVT